MEETLERITAMRHQERSGYAKRGWLQLESSEVSKDNQAVDIDCREKMLAWCFQIVDFCEYSRATVEIAISYIDRYLASPEGIAARQDRGVFQLVCMTALYTAIKLHERIAIDTNVFSRFSKGVHRPEDFEAMEVKLLNALKWRVNPPTSMDFVRLLLESVPDDILDKYMHRDVYDLTKMQTELVFSSDQFVSVPASTVAYCALMNALDNLGLSSKDLGYVGYFFALALGIDYNSDDVIDVQSFLYPFVALQLIGRRRRRKERCNSILPKSKSHRRR